ncbi:GNAT family N-acetyltransferase [Kitasatospora sp. NPDC048365]|uniref:GNAT family N-acetyltransferase n=1 Tax=Kitasatospora sp. NPDC048365 TaxID=3364050 RepID=UPI00371FEED1
MDLPQPVIDLDDLTLRRFEEADLPEFLRVIDESLEHLAPWMAWTTEHTPERTAEFLARRGEKWESGQAYSYAIVLDGAIVGAIELFRGEGAPDNSREIGYWLHPAATGRGLVTRAARAVAAQAFRLPEVDWVEIVHDPANLASGAVPARLGFTVHLRRPAERHAPAETGEDQVWRLTRARACAD